MSVFLHVSVYSSVFCEHIITDEQINVSCHFQI